MMGQRPSRSALRRKKVPEQDERSRFNDRQPMVTAFDDDGVVMWRRFWLRHANLHPSLTSSFYSDLKCLKVGVILDMDGYISEHMQQLDG